MLVLQFYIKKGKKNGGKEAYEIDLYIHYHKKTKLTEAGQKFGTVETDFRKI